jgi:carbon monoxide dehydrogenase subunit G
MAMELDHSFTVPVPPERAWDVLLDVNGIAPCMPGATVEEFDGEVVTGRIKVKVGPVSLTYRGTAKFTERDPDARIVVVEANGKETRGAGTASANVRASLAPEGDGSTKVDIHTTMNVTGRPAQFGRGVIAEVGGKLIEQFATNLSQLIASGGTDAAAAEAPAAEGPADSAPAPAEESAAATDGAGSPAGETAPAAFAGTPAAAPEAAGAPAAVAGLTGPGSTQMRPVQPDNATPAVASEDSINLLKLVGPAILKRAVPAAAAATIVALLGRLLLRRRRSAKS